VGAAGMYMCIVCACVGKIIVSGLSNEGCRYGDPCLLMFQKLFRRNLALLQKF